MKDFKVLFIYPNLRGMNMLPPAIALFSRILKDNGVEVVLFDTTYYKIGDDFDSDKEKEKNLAVRPFDISKKITLKTTDPFDDLDILVNSFQPNLIAMSATEDIFPLGLRLLKHIDKYNILTVMGGVFPTFAPHKVILNKEIDIVCVGEGERRKRDSSELFEIDWKYLSFIKCITAKNKIIIISHSQNSFLLIFEPNAISQSNTF